jgi:hypothetical protein
MLIFGKGALLVPMKTQNAFTASILGRMTPRDGPSAKKLQWSII